MKSEIKKRIEQVRHGNVPDGYKKTEIGIFPCEWTVYRLGQLLEFKNGINAEKERFGQGIKLISVQDILTEAPITYDSIRSAVDIDCKQVENFAVTYGDILFQRSSENYEDAGTSNVYLDSENKAVFSGFVIRGKKIGEYNPIYLNALLRTAYVRKNIIRKAASPIFLHFYKHITFNYTAPYATNQPANEIKKAVSPFFVETAFVYFCISLAYACGFCLNHFM